MAQLFDPKTFVLAPLERRNSATSKLFLKTALCKGVKQELSRASILDLLDINNSTSETLLLLPAACNAVYSPLLDTQLFCLSLSDIF